MITNNLEGVVVDVKTQENIVTAIQQLLSEPEKMTSFGIASF